MLLRLTLLLVLAQSTASARLSAITTCPIASKLISLSGSSCHALASTCSLHYLGASGCTSKQGPLHDGGCQPSNQCGFCCEAQCKRARHLFDKQCLWTGSQCILCDGNGPVNNGGPVLGSPNVLPNWLTDGAGDLVQIFPACLTKPFITGMQLYMTETNLDAVSLVGETIQGRVIVFQHSQQIVSIDWSGSCNVTQLALFGSGNYQVLCDFANGVLRVPTECGTYPELAPDFYNVLFSQSTSNTLAWMTSQPSTGCTFQNQCAYTQTMAAVGNLPQTDLCLANGDNLAFRSLAFQLVGSASVTGRKAPTCF
jgi:hypothetical protein